MNNLVSNNLNTNIFYCVLKRKKNNFFATIIKENGRDVLLNKSCGALPGMRGSKKYTTVAVETLGKELFLNLFSLGLGNCNMELVLRSKIDKFSRSFVRGLLLYGKGYVKLQISSEILISHNGIRAKKKRRV